MSTGTGTGTAKGFKEATPEQVKHLLETHLRIFIDQTNDEVYITYSLKDGDSDRPVTFRMCPAHPCHP